MVPEHEFERVRQLLQAALDKAYADYLVKPAELAPGHWEMWPTRSVRLTLEEARFWMYGVPGEGTGKLQADIEFPYGNHDRIRPKKGTPFTEKLATRAAKSAEEISNMRVQHYKLDRSSQEGYLFGYNTIVEMPDEKRVRFWAVREPTYKAQANWAPLHESVHRLFEDSRQQDPKEWDALFSGPKQHMTPREWSPRTRGYSQNNYDNFFHGVLDALDDWALETGRRKIQ